MVVKHNVLQANEFIIRDDPEYGEDAGKTCTLVAGVFCYDGIRHSSRAIVLVGEQVGQAGHVGAIQRIGDELRYEGQRIDAIEDAL